MGANRGQTLDHIIPIEVGGCAACAENLQLQDKAQAKAKDRLENSTRRAICSGRMTLKDGQAVFENPAQ
jgi:hypothetical protein